MEVTSKLPEQDWGRGEAGILRGHPKSTNEGLLPKRDFANKESLNRVVFIYGKIPAKIS